MRRLSVFRLVYESVALVLSDPVRCGEIGTKSVQTWASGAGGESHHEVIAELRGKAKRSVRCERVEVLR
jgi:hypothetical protein